MGADLKDTQVQLRDGRIVTMRESTGADDMVVAAQLGKLFEANAGGAMIFQTCMMARCIESIDEQKVPSMKSYSEYRDFVAQFRGKDLVKIKTKYNELNGEDEVGKPESSIE